MPSHQNRQWSDEYMMYEYKVKQCLRTDHHNWKHCPWRHPGESAAQRRHPSVHKPTFCMNLKMAGECTAGDECPFSHNTFEMSLHPLRYKTTLCNLGEKCNREICFFAHSHKDLRTPEPEGGAADTTPAATAAAAAAGVSGVALSDGSSTAGVAAPNALGLMTGTGEVVQISGGSFSSRSGGVASAASGVLSPGGGGGGGLVLLQQVEQSAGSGMDQQQQLLLLMQLNSQQQQVSLQQQQQQQQLMGLESSAVAAGDFQVVEAGGPSGGFLSRVLTGTGRGSMRGLEQQQQQQPAISRQGLCNFDSFTSQGSFSGRQAASLQQQLLLQLQQQQQTAMTLRQDLSGFDSFTSQGSFSAAGGKGSFPAGGGSFTAAADGSNFSAGSSAAAAMLQQQQQQHAAAAALRQELANFGDSFTSQGSFSAGAGGSFSAGAGIIFSAGDGSGSFNAGAGGSFTAGGGAGSFTVSGSGGSFTAGGRGLALQHQQHQQAAALLQQELTNCGDSFTSQGSRSIASLQQQAMLLRQELTGYDSVTSQSSFSTTGGGSFTRSAAPGAALLQQQPPILDGAFDSFTSQCSTSSQVSGPGYRSMPLSPLLDRSQGSAGMQGAQGFAALTVQTGQAGQILPRVLAAPSPPGSSGATAASMLFQGMGQGASVGSGGNGSGSAMLPLSGAAGRRSMDVGLMLAPACAGGPTSGNLLLQQLAAKQQQEAATAAVQQQVMQLQLHSPDWQH